MLGGDFGSFGSAGKRTSQNYGRSRLDALQKLRHFVHFFLTAFGQWALVVRLFPIRPISLAVSEKINVHVDLPLNLSLNLLDDLPLWPARAWIDLPESRSAEKCVAVVSELGAFGELLQLLRVSPAEDNVIRDK